MRLVRSAGKENSKSDIPNGSSRLSCPIRFSIPVKHVTDPYTVAMDSGTTESFGREWDTPDEPDIDLADIPDIDPTKPHTARIYDYGLGGKNHFAADREPAKKVFAAKPPARIAGRDSPSRNK